MRITKSLVPGGKPTLLFNQGRWRVSVGDIIKGQVKGTGLQNGTRVSLEIGDGRDKTIITPLSHGHSFHVGQEVTLLVNDIGEQGQIRTSFVDSSEPSPAPGPIMPPTPRLAPTSPPAPVVQVATVQTPTPPAVAVPGRPKLADLLAQIDALPKRTGMITKAPLILACPIEGDFDDGKDLEACLIYGTVLYPANVSYPNRFTFAKVGSRNSAHGPQPAYVEVGYLKALAALWTEPRPVTFNARVKYSDRLYIPLTCVVGNEYYFEVPVEGGVILLKSMAISRAISLLPKPERPCTFTVRISFDGAGIAQLNRPNTSLFDLEYPNLSLVPTNLFVSQ